MTGLWGRLVTCGPIVNRSSRPLARPHTCYIVLEACALLGGADPLVRAGPPGPAFRSNHRLPPIGDKTAADRGPTEYVALVVCGKQNNQYPATAGQPILAAAGFQPASPAGVYVYFDAKEPPERRLRAELPAPHNRQGFGRATLATLLLAASLLTSCGSYADFTLPPLAGGDPTLTFTLDERAGPVLTEPEQEALNPSVVAARGLVNFYSRFDGRTWQTAMASSADGIDWQRRGTILSPDPHTWEGSYIAANGSALIEGGKWWYWYQAGPKANPRIGLLREGTPREGGVREPNPVLGYGPYMSWDERAVADPGVIRIEPFFYLYYLGQDRADPPRQRLGLARSRDGVHWEKLRANPILSPGGPGAFDENGVGEPAVWQFHGFYWMLFTGRDRGERRRLGLARSTDGVHWRKLPQVFAGAEAWDSAVICDASAVVNGEEIRVWFGGGDAAKPDEGIDGRIGYGTLRPVHATLTP